MVTMYEIYGDYPKPIKIGDCDNDDKNSIKQMKEGQVVNFNSKPPVITWIVYNNKY